VRRKSVRRSRGGPRRQTDWIPFREAGTEGSTSALFALVDAQDLVDKDGKLTVERIVGEAYFDPIDGGGASTLATCFEGIILSDLDNTGSVTNWLPANATDAEAPWLFRRMTICGIASGTTFAFGGVLDFAAAHMDVGAKRKMSERMDLLYVVQMFPSPFAAISNPVGFGWTINLRTLVKLA